MTRETNIYVAIFKMRKFGGKNKKERKNPKNLF